MLHLFASKISNLTDARYFAAFMPQYMSIPLPADHPDEIRNFHEIKSWVEGVQWAVEVGSEAVDDLLARLHALHVDTVVVHDLSNANLVTPPLHVILSITNLDDMKHLRSRDLSKYHELILPQGVDAQTLSHLADQFTIPIWAVVSCLEDWDRLRSSSGMLKGIVVEGSEEEKVGFKSYNEINELLEVLMDEG